MTKERIALVGAGAAGGALVLALHRAGYPIEGIASRSMESARRCAERTATELASDDPARVVVNADIIIIATPDDRIESACQSIVEQGVIRPGQLFLHLSGALTSEALASARRKGAEVMSMHPIQALADPAKGADLLRGAYFCLEGSEAAIRRGEQMVQAMQGHTLRIPAESKALYHAALCIASNYLVTLEAVAASLLERIGVQREEGLQALLPLIRGSAENLAHSGLPGALTGPISRADLATVAKHIDSLRGEALEYQELYRLLGEETIRLALEKGGMDGDEAEQMRLLLTPRPPDECLIS